MKYRLNIESLSQLEPCKKSFDYDSEYDDFSSISSDISDVLHEMGVVFQLQVDNVEIPIFIWGDFEYFLDGFYEYAGFLFSNQKSEFMFELLEQGIETQVCFSIEDDRVKVSEENFYMGSYYVKMNELRSDFKRFFKEFISLIDLLIPGISLHTWFKQWREGIQSIINDVHGSPACASLFNGHRKCPHL
ncbi:hypothetical protein FUAX_17870 [Fulvitalea axinellae]|uniref:Uncharacterized protein n=1 Tax=Fulvitalea axinellae TaxID=1182444 RepID=A0AAU9DEJ0_9BACT|nr:hypothetical protein FUAX_17870 [Fulvitalea axinellae]